MKTEDRQDCSIGFSEQSTEEMLRLMLQAQLQAASCVNDSCAELIQAAEQMARTIRTGNRLFYSGAGSSGLMALADSLELPGTFGIDPRQIQLLLAGGQDSLHLLKGAPDDDIAQATAEIERYQLSANDCLICVSASGFTPYTLQTQRLARSCNTPAIALACNAKSPLLAEADIPVLLQTPAEVIAGSTRLGAGTAQKIALNLMSSLMASLLGHVYDGHMVNLQVDSDKLRRRAAGIVGDLSGCNATLAADYLARADGEVKVAVLLASGCKDAVSAKVCLQDCLGNLGAALSSLDNRKPG